MSEWIEISIPFGAPWMSDGDSLSSRGLARPGVQIEMSDGRRYLIGDIDTGGQVGVGSGESVEVDSGDIVARYRVVFTPGAPDG